MVSLCGRGFESLQLHPLTQQKLLNLFFSSFCCIYPLGRAVDGSIYQTALYLPSLFDNHLLVVDDVDAIAQVQFAHRRGGCNQVALQAVNLHTLVAE